MSKPHPGLPLINYFEVEGQPEPASVPADRVETGRQLIASYGCGSCHSIPGVPGADARAAPPLDGYYERSYIAGQLPNTEENLVQWIQHPQEIKPETAMPDLGVTADEARAMVAYLYHSPGLEDVIHR